MFCLLAIEATFRFPYLSVNGGPKYEVGGLKERATRNADEFPGPAATNLQFRL
jgi:hypothetical protein